MTTKITAANFCIKFSGINLVIKPPRKAPSKVRIAKAIIAPMKTEKGFFESADRVKMAS